MKVIRSIKEMQETIKTLKSKIIGFVPTMGYLHEGHTSLMQEARKSCDIVVASIFVNPLQFGPNEDFETYPRDEERDQSIAQDNGVDILFMPSAQEMYPENFAISMQIHKRVNALCGQSREGHFDGVITVLTKLFHIVQPQKVFFGMKDAQQLAIVDSLITDLNFSIELIGCPTVREADGLAKSSRNVYLSETEREEAVWLYRALLHGKQLINEGESNPQVVIQAIENLIKEHTHGRIDYVDILSYPELKPISKINEQIIIAVAVHFNQARLIDNLILTPHGDIVEYYKR